MTTVWTLMVRVVRVVRTNGTYHRTVPMVRMVRYAGDNPFRGSPVPYHAYHGTHLARPINQTPRPYHPQVEV